MHLKKRFQNNRTGGDGKSDRTFASIHRAGRSLKIEARIGVIFIELIDINRDSTVYIS
jgi:hypothetical protein